MSALVYMDDESMADGATALDSIHDAVDDTVATLRGIDPPDGLSPHSSQLIAQGADLVDQLGESVHLESRMVRKIRTLFLSVGAVGADELGQAMPLKLDFTEIRVPKKTPWYLQPFKFGAGLDQEVWSQVKNLTGLGVMLFVLNPANKALVDRVPALRKRRDDTIAAFKTLYHHPTDIINGVKYNVYGDLIEDAHINGKTHAAGMTTVRVLELLGTITNVTKLTALSRAADIEKAAKARGLSPAEVERAVKDGAGKVGAGGLKVAGKAEDIAAAGDIRTAVRFAADKAFTKRRGELQSQWTAAADNPKLRASIQRQLDEVDRSQKSVHALTEGKGALATDVADHILRDVEKGTEQGNEQREDKQREKEYANAG